MLSITLLLTADALKKFREDRSDLVALAQQFGGQLIPLHPGSADPDLERFFTVEAPDPTQSETIVGTLRQHPEVEAAYVKPPGGPP